MNISIFASIGAQNLWDECILKNEIELLKQEFWELSPSPSPREGSIEFKVASYDPKNPIFQITNTHYFEYFPIGIKNPRNIFKNIKNFFKFLQVIIWSDIVVIWWWGIIYDSEIQSANSPLNQWILRANTARLFWKKLYFYAVWIDIKNKENTKKLEKIFQKAWKVTVRDKKSQEQLKEIGIKSEIVDDPVMQESPHLWEELKWGYVKGNILKTLCSQNFSTEDFKMHDFTGKKVGLALRSWYMWSEGNKKVEELCQFIENKWGKIVFLPHSLHPTDIQANDYEFMKQFINYEREIYASLGEVYSAYTHKLIDIVISMRLHSIILSYVYGIDQITLSYSQKTEEVLKKFMK